MIDLDADGVDSIAAEEVESKPRLTHRQEASRETIKYNIYTEIEKVCNEGDEEESYKDVCCVRCIDLCCQSCTCTLSNLLARNDKQKLLSLSPRQD